MTNTASVPDPVVADRAVGVIVASAAGDALGAPFEFGPAVGDDVSVAMTGGGGYGWGPGEWTDDTQMALAILIPLSEGNDDVAEVEAGFRAWFESGPADVGNQTRAVLSSPDPLAEAAARFTRSRPHGAAGNGSLMRTGPVALSHPGDPDAIAALAQSVSELTHPDVDCVDACVIWSVAIDHTTHHAPASDMVWDWAESLRHSVNWIPADRRPRWLQLIDHASVAVPTDFPKNGWVVHAFQAAVAAICSTPVPAGPTAAMHLRRALDRAVRSGGDTDTVAAIAGSLLGARWGATAVPFEWRRVVHGERIRGQLLDNNDLERMARLAYGGGQPDGIGWPGVRSLLRHYDATWPIAPKWVDVADVRFGNVAALPEVLAAGTDVVISLCRMGTADVPAEVEHQVITLLDTTPEANPNVVLLLADLVDGLWALTEQGQRVFVHCVQAENRTPTVAAALLHRRHGMSADDALADVADKFQRPKQFLVDAVAAIDQVPRND